MKKQIVHYCNQRALVSNPEEAIAAIESFHSYNNKNLALLVVNDYVRKVIENFFSDEPQGYVIMKKWGEERKSEYTPTHICTTNCGNQHISFHPALADTLEEHQRLYKAKCDEEKAERIRKSEEAFRKRREEYNEVRKGWYVVSFNDFKCLNSWGRFCYKSWTGTCIAKSKYDAALKAIKQIEYLDLPEKGCQLAFILEPLNAEVEFLGMKTDNGYSLKQWEEFSKTEEYKQSLKD